MGQGRVSVDMKKNIAAVAALAYVALSSVNVRAQGTEYWSPYIPHPQGIQNEPIFGLDGGNVEKVVQDMGRSTIVVARYNSRLPSGEPWPIAIFDFYVDPYCDGKLKLQFFGQLDAKKADALWGDIGSVVFDYDKRREFAEIVGGRRNFNISEKIDEDSPHYSWYELTKEWRPGIKRAEIDGRWKYDEKVMLNGSMEQVERVWREGLDAHESVKVKVFKRANCPTS